MGAQQGFENMIIGVNNKPLFDMELFPDDYHLIHNDTFYPNKEAHKFSLYNLKSGDRYSIIVPNRTNVRLGKDKFYFQTRGIKMKVNFKLQVLNALRPIQIPTTQTTLTGQVKHEFSDKVTFDFDTERICPKCGTGLKIDFNFCKYCGQDLNDIKPLGRADAVTKNLAVSSLTDPDPEVRKEAIDTLGGFKDTSTLGVLAYILLHDADENVREEAADEIGDIHHPISVDVLSLALKDPSAIVRKEAIEGLKKIKEKLKPKKDSDD